MRVTEIEIHFEGWFMCRLATDPDPTDEPRGVSGTTFAYGSEPDLDRIIRLHDSEGLERSHCPEIGVWVTQAKLGEQQLPEMIGSKVDLLGEPKFENRNFVLTMAGKEPIVPFNLHISNKNWEFSRDVRMSDTVENFEKIPRNVLEKFGARGFYTADQKVLGVMKIDNPLQNRITRRDKLQNELNECNDLLTREVLKRRIIELEIAIDEPENERLVNMRAIEEFSFDLNGSISEKNKGIDWCEFLETNWKVNFWMGGWDPDALSGYLCGDVKIPIKLIETRKESNG